MRTINRRCGRIGIVAAAIGAWVVVASVLIGVGRGEATRGGTLTTFGLSGWLEVKSPRLEAVQFVELLVPGKKFSPTVRPMRATIALLLLGALTVYLLVGTRRSLANLSPRSKCCYCGYVITDSSPQTNICPECGHLPNFHREPWALWR
ncbi:MAG: hypothetical protein GY715_12080 [Planctomycetes bacterium]|nr:hypothetical protein [Planctomycetota bacterium]